MCDWVKINYSVHVHGNEGTGHPVNQCGSLLFNSFWISGALCLISDFGYTNNTSLLVLVFSWGLFCVLKSSCSSSRSNSRGPEFKARWLRKALTVVKAVVLKFVFALLSFLCRLLSRIHKTVLPFPICMLLQSCCYAGNTAYQPVLLQQNWLRWPWLIVWQMKDIQLGVPCSLYGVKITWP